MSVDVCRVLLVDDEPAFLDLLVDQLERIHADFDVVTETDPTAALDRLDSGLDVDCIVSDYRMPELSGIEFLRAVRDRESTPFIILTGEGDEAVASEAIDAGATNYLRKAATREDAERLAAAVRDAVATYREQRLLREEYEFLDTVLGSLDDIVYVADTDGTPLFWNEAANRVTGYSSAEARSLDTFDLFPEDEHERVHEAIATVLEAGTVTFEAELLTKDGERIPHEFSGTTIRNEDGTVVGICGIGRDVTRRERYERTLRSLHQTTRDLLEATTRDEVASIVVTATEHIVDAPLSTVQLRRDGTLVPVAASDETRRVMGDLSRYALDEDVPAVRAYRSGTAELVEDVARIEDDRDRGTASQALYLPMGEYGVLSLALPAGETFAETDRQLAEILVANATAAMTRHERERALQNREQMLTTLHGTTRNLIRASDPVKIADVIAADAAEVLDLTATAVFLWDDHDGVLRPVATTDDVEELFGDLPVVRGPDTPVWEAFVESEACLVDTADGDGVDVAEESVRSQLLVPIGDYGVLLSGSPEPSAFGDTAVEFAELLATNAATAIREAERERSLAEKDRRLEERNEQLRRVNRLNAIIRDINQALVQAGSRAEIQQVVCDTLTDVDHYAFTWIGAEDVLTDDLTARASAGDGRDFLDAVLVDGPADAAPIPRRVMANQEPIVVDSVHRDERFEPWRKEALNRGFQSLACFPLTYAGTEYGFLEIYADQPGVFFEEEVTVLSELAAHIANAISAVERKEALLTGRATELEFELQEVDDPVFALAERTGAILDVDGLVPHGPGAWIVYASMNGADPDAFVAAAEESTVVDDATVIRADVGTDGGALVGLTLEEFSIANVLADQGATIRTLRIGPEAGRVTVTVSPSTNVRSFVDACRDRFPDLRLTRRQTVTEEISGGGLKYDLDRLLTDKQLEALQTAYFTGYFEWPREATGADVADSLDVSPPTFQQHLRKALGRIFADTFEDGETEPE